jgi:WD40 repeat protein
MYKYDSQMNLTAFPGPADVTQSVLGFAARKDGKFVAICSLSRLQLYRRSNGAFIRVTITNDVATSSTQDARFSEDGNWLFASFLGGPYVMAYQRAADDSTYVRVPTALVNGLSNAIYAITPSPDGQHVAMADQYGPYLRLYKWNGSNFTTTITGPTLYGAQVADVAYSPDGTYLALATYNGTCNLQILKNNFDGTYTKLTDTQGKIVGGAAHGVRFSPDGQHIALAVGTAPFCVIYKWDGTALTRLTNAPATIATQGYRVSYSPDGKYLAIVVVGGSGLPIAHIWQRSGDAYTELKQVPGTAGRGIAWGPVPT